MWDLFKKRKSTVNIKAEELGTSLNLDHLPSYKHFDMLVSHSRLDATLWYKAIILVLRDMISNTTNELSRELGVSWTTAKKMKAAILEKDRDEK